MKRFKAKKQGPLFVVFDTLLNRVPPQYSKPQQEGIVVAIIEKLNQLKWHRDLRPLGRG